MALGWPGKESVLLEFCLQESVTNFLIPKGMQTPWPHYCRSHPLPPRLYPKTTSPQNCGMDVTLTAADSLMSQELANSCPPTMSQAVLHLLLA